MDVTCWGFGAVFADGEYAGVIQRWLQTRMHNVDRSLALTAAYITDANGFTVVPSQWHLSPLYDYGIVIVSYNLTSFFRHAWSMIARLWALRGIASSSGSVFLSDCCPQLVCLLPTIRVAVSSHQPMKRRRPSAICISPSSLRPSSGRER